MGLGNVPRRAELVMDLGKLDQLVDYQPADMTATVEAGVTLMSLQQQLAPGGEFVLLNQLCPADPPWAAPCPWGQEDPWHMPTDCLGSGSLALA